MTKHTPRDYVWDAALDLREEDQEVINPWGENGTEPMEFGAPEIKERIGEDAPSDKTIRDVLMTMRDCGRLKNAISCGSPKNGVYVRVPDEED